jgi:hypothetical protein
LPQATDEVAAAIDMSALKTAMHGRTHDNI